MSTIRHLNWYEVDNIFMETQFSSLVHCKAFHGKSLSLLLYEWNIIIKYTVVNK